MKRTLSIYAVTQKMVNDQVEIREENRDGGPYHLDFQIDCQALKFLDCFDWSRH